MHAPEGTGSRHQPAAPVKTLCGQLVRLLHEVSLMVELLICCCLQPSGQSWQPPETLPVLQGSNK